ncbi:MAG: hypothetical protein K6E38_02825 [Fretibacterium sp.]|nr:hypothetical protein [Fretibacterium sp.]
MAKKRLGYGDFYCWNCGKNIEKGHDSCPFCGAEYGGDEKFGDVPSPGAGGVGWSHQENHPSFEASHRRNRRMFQIFMVILSLGIGFILFVLPGELEFNEEGLKIYAGVLAIVWAIDLIWYFVSNKSKKGWEGAVIGKEKEEYTREIRDEDNDTTRTEHHTRYIVHFRKDDGKREKLTVTDSPEWYDYLNEGDRVRYHGKKSMNYYEKYDKSHDEFIPCAGCGSLRDAREKFCGRCGCIILKAR